MQSRLETFFKILFQISAQESRRKKKEYMDTLEKKMDKLACEVSDHFSFRYKKYFDLN